MFRSWGFVWMSKKKKWNQLNSIFLILSVEKCRLIKLWFLSLSNLFEKFYFNLILLLSIKISCGIFKTGKNIRIAITSFLKIYFSNKVFFFTKINPSLLSCTSTHTIISPSKPTHTHPHHRYHQLEKHIKISLK